MVKTTTRIATYFRDHLYTIPLFTIAVIVSLYLRYRLIPVLGANPLNALVGDSDSLSYLRTFDLIVAKFPHLPASLDYYSNYPWGLNDFLPPIWPYLLALFAVPVSFVLHLEPVQVAGLLVVILGVASAIPIYLLAKEMFGKDVALVSASISLFLPRFVLLSDQKIDHHVADLFLVPLVFALLLMARRHFAEGRIRRALSLAALGGATVALSMLISLSLVLIICMVLLPVLIGVFLLSKEELKPTLASLGALFGFSAVVLGLLSLFTSWFSPTLEFSRLSYLQIAAFGLVAAVGVIGYLVLRAGVGLATFRVLTAVAAIVLAVGIVFGAPSLHRALVNGYYRSIGSYPIGMRTKELMPVFASGIGEVITNYTYLIFAVPVIIAALIISDVKGRKIDFGHLFFYLIFGFLAFYTIQARYYDIFLSIFLVIVYGLGVSWLAGLLHEVQKGTKSAGLTQKALLAICTVAALILALPTDMASAQRSTNPNLLDLAKYIRESTPTPGGFLSPDKKPAYGVMCSWGQSYRLEYLSARATVPTGNHDVGMQGIIASERFYQALNEDAALKVLNGLNVKYVVGDGQLDFWQGDISKIGESMPQPDRIVRCLGPGEISSNTISQTMAARLYNDASVSTLTTDKVPLHHFRLLFISSADKGEAPCVLYEVVKGACITVKGAPNQPTSVVTSIHTNDGRVLAWGMFGQTNKDGLFSTVAPYPTRGTRSPTMAEPYVVQMGGKERRLNIDKKTVEDGGAVSLTF